MVFNCNRLNFRVLIVRPSEALARKPFDLYLSRIVMASLGRTINTLLNLASKSPSRESKSPRSQLSRNLSPFSLAKKGSRLLPEENFDLSGQSWGQGRSQRSSVSQ